MSCGPQKNSIAVIGAGIVGLCTAYSLKKAGYTVTVIDPEPPGSQCSFGNAGALSAGSVAPLAMPGVLKQTLSMLLDSSSPLHVPFYYWLPALPWFMRFAASAQPDKVQQIAQALSFLLSDAVRQHRELAREVGCSQLIKETGQLHIYPDDQALSKDAGSWALKNAFGQRFEKLDAAGIQALEPAVSSRYKAGLFLPEDTWIAQPYQYARAIAADLQRQGVPFVQAKVQALTRGDQGWRYTDGSWSGASEHVVISAGMGSRRLLQGLGWKVPLEAQRGYHVQVPQPGIQLSRVVVLADRKVFMNPMDGQLRIAGTVEFGSIDRPMNKRRAMLLKEHAQQGLDGLKADDFSLWMGLRPCLPDSLPVLGPVPDAPGLWCAFGHGHLGLTGSSNTGRLLARAISGRADPAELAPFSIRRF